MLLSLVRWILVLELLSVAMLPSLFYFFRKQTQFIPGMLKTFSLFFFAVFTTLLAESFSLPVTPPALGLTLLGVATIQWALLIRGALLPDFLIWIRSSFKRFIRFEIIFSVVFMIAGFYRMRFPSLTGTEKPMEQAILAALLRTSHLPAQDPWFSGHAIPYYTLGFFTFSIPGKLLNLSLFETFNLSVMTIPALLATSGFSFISTLGQSLRLSKKNVFFAALATVWFLCFAGNGAAFLESLYSKGLIPDSVVQKINIQGMGPSVKTGTFFPDSGFLWRSTRVVSDTDSKTGARQEVIHEYPFFSHLLADFHPHWMSLVLWVLFLCFWITLLRREEAPSLGDWIFFAASFSISVRTNPWDLPALLLFSFLLLFHSLRRHRGSFFQLLPGAALSFFSMLQFRLQYTPPVSKISWFSGFTAFDQGLLAYTPLLVLTPLLLPKRLESRSRFFWMALVAICAAVLLLKGFFPAVLIFILISLARKEWLEESPLFWILFVAVLWLMIPEFFFIKDAFGTRMNTVFKFSYLSWTLFSLSLPLLLFRHLNSKKNPVAIAVCIFVFFTTLPAPLFGTLARMNENSPSFYEEEEKFGAWNEMAAWLNVNAKEEDALVELPSDSYGSQPLLSTLTGVPSFLGWKGHEFQWRGWTNELAGRAQALEYFYKLKDSASIAGWMKENRIRFAIRKTEDLPFLLGPEIKIAYRSKDHLLVERIIH